MSKEREALKLALEAAYLAGFNASGEGYNGEYPFGDKMQNPAENRVWKKDRDNYIKETLAQPEQEPVAWRVRWPKMGGGYVWIMNDAPLMAKQGFVNEPLYTTPPQRTWVMLTNEEVMALAFNFDVPSLVIRTIEAKLKEKNT